MNFLILNPLDLHGADSIIFILALAAAFHFFSWKYRQWILRTKEPVHQIRTLTNVELAILREGADRAASVARYELVQQNRVRLSEESGTAELVDESGPETSPVHAAIVHKLKPGPVQMHVLRRAVEPELKRMEASLARDGLLVDDQVQVKQAMIGFLLALVPTAYMIQKGIVGSAQGYPIGYLVLIAIVSTSIAFAHFFCRSRTTEWGQSVVTQFEKQRTTLPVNDPTRVALDGAGVIAGTSFALIPQLMVFHPPTAKQNSGGCSGVTGCSSAGCGRGGGCGGGGCGG